MAKFANNITLILSVVCISLAIFFPINVAAFPTETYASSSVLASGKWVKVSVEQTGLHFISNSTLRSWGFSNADKVSVHGYGGQRLSDKLSQSNYIDDLPQLQVYRTEQGIYFYAKGPESWTRTASGNYYHTLNPFSSFGYYFISDGVGVSDRDVPTEGFDKVTGTPSTVFMERIYHELEQISPGQTGHLLLGEDFRYSRTRTFNFELTDKASEDSKPWVRSSFGAAVTSRSTLAYTVNNVPLPQTTSITPINDYTYGSRVVFSSSVDVAGDKLSFGITFQPQGVASMANLDAISVNYQRKIALKNGSLQFRAVQSSVSLTGATASTHVWDVTDDANIVALRTHLTDNGVAWTNTYSGHREYVAWNDGASLPSPKYVAAIENQDLHAIASLPDMVIVTPRDWLGEANRLANFHRQSPDALNVEVIDQDYIYNEFGSGCRDVNAIRRFLKMLYDKGNEAGHPLRYVLLFGRASFDNRLLTDEMKALKEPFIPTWESDDGMSKISSFTTDDVVGLLEDESGSSLGKSQLSVAVGRAPIHNLTNAKTFVDKVIAYSKNTYPTDWKNQVLLMADNGDLGVFMEDSEREYTNMLNSVSGQDLFYTKVYIDAFTIIGGECSGGRQRLHQMLDDGVVWWSYIGHGALTTLAEENVMTNTDINNMYNRRWPMMFAATCSFSMHDGSRYCGTETMLLTPNAGIIASLAPTRESMISHNGTIAASIGSIAFERDETGRFYTIGDIVRRTKNYMISNASNEANNQKLYYVLLGDPALRLAMPSSRLALEQIDGVDVTEDNQCTIKARQRVRLTGSVYSPEGNLMDDFNGTLSLRLFDAEYSTTSNGATTGGGKPTEGKEVTFEEQGSKLYVGRDSIKNGRFDVIVPMPSEVSDNFRPAALNMYAYTADGQEAIGCNRMFYVYGYDDSAEPDTQAPVIDYAYLNHESFEQGSVVNESPMFIARVSDDVGINLSTAGIGHQMTLKLDGNKSYNDVAFYYTPSADGSQSGTIAYPIDELSQGNHTLAFRVWDTSGNSATHTLNFFVEQGAKPKIFDIYTDVNPASTEANFYVTHNRPDATITVTLDIYDMSGRRVWTTTATDRSDMFSSAPINWNLTDMGGHRVARGIYIYRATVSADGYELQSAARRIAVTAQ